MPKKANSAPASNAPPCVHATGHLTGAAPGILEGSVSFPVRGEIRFRMERRPNDRIGECAKLFALTANPSECDMVLIAQLDEPEHWHGFLMVEGYLFQVRAERDGKRMAVTFLDAKQPHWPPRASWLEAAA